MQAFKNEPITVNWTEERKRSMHAGFVKVRERAKEIRPLRLNGSLDDAPEKVNSDPYGEGWIFVVEMSDPGELDALMDAAGYRGLVEEG